MDALASAVVLIVALASAVAAVAVTGCGDDDVGAPDGGPPAPDSGMIMIAPPLPPALTPCPTGWREARDRDGDPAHCDPWPTSGFTACAEGEAMFPGAACAPIGDPCPAGDFPEGLPTDVPVIYVAASAPPGGDGTLGAPLSRIGDALGGLPTRGTVIAIAKGRYDERVRVPNGVTLAGACAAETILAPSAADPTQPVIAVVGDDVAIENLALDAGGGHGGIWSMTPHALSVRGVRVVDPITFGLIGVGGEVTVDGLVITGSARPPSGMPGRGITLQSGVVATLHRVLVVGATDLAMQILDGAVVTLEDTAIRDTGTPTGQSAAIFLAQAATLTARRVVVEGDKNLGLSLDSEGTHATLEDVVVRDNAPPTETSRAAGALVVRLGALTADRLYVSGVDDLAVVAEEGATMTLRDVVVRATGPEPATGIEGRGVSFQLGASGTLERALVTANHDYGVFLQAGTTTLRDVTVDATLGRDDDGTFGRGVEAQAGAQVTVERLRVVGNHDVGLAAFQEGTIVSGTHVEIRDTLSRPDGASGLGVTVQAGAVVELEDVWIDSNRSGGVMAYDLGTRVTLTRATVTNTAARDCARDTCVDDPAGSAVVAVQEAAVSMTDFAITNSALCGVLLTEGGTLDLSHGTVRGHLIGACIQTDGFDVARLQNDVAFSANGTNLDATTLPVPEPLPAGG